MARSHKHTKNLAVELAQSEWSMELIPQGPKGSPEIDMRRFLSLQFGLAC